MPPWISLDDRPEVPLAKSSPSNRATRRPRMAASRATPQPVIPPPITRRSNCSPEGAVILFLLGVLRNQPKYKEFDRKIRISPLLLHRHHSARAAKQTVRSGEYHAVLSHTGRRRGDRKRCPQNPAVTGLRPSRSLRVGHRLRAMPTMLENLQRRQ